MTTTRRLPIPLAVVLIPALLAARLCRCGCAAEHPVDTAQKT
jgi:hypothetical protein